MSIAATKGTGWMKDYPDFRDNTPATTTITPKQELRGVKESVKDTLKKLNPPAALKKAAAKKKALIKKKNIY